MGLNIKKITPRFNQVICTMDKYTDKELKKDSIIDLHKVTNPIREYQKVIAVGPMVRDIKEGDLVMVNPKRYAQMKHKEGSLKDGVIGDNLVVNYNFNVIEIDHVHYLLLTDQDVDFIINDYEIEEEANTGDIIVPNNDIIL